jgi:cysteinyl-tRNA synthetase
LPAIGCTSAFCSSKARRCRRAEGNFYTLRDLILLGHKPSSIRWLLTQVPYRNQLNFTFDGLKSAASSVEKLRNFKFRLERAARDLAPSSRTTEAALAAEGRPASPTASNSALYALAHETADRITAALDDDLNTAEAQAAIFDMLRKANTALDTAEAGQNQDGQNNVRQDDVQALLATLGQFDAIFAILKDDDQPKMKAILDWAKAEGGEKEKEISPALQEIAGTAQLADEQVNQKLAEMEAARKSRNFKASDALRAELTGAGIIVENTKDGVRWRRK